MGKTPCEKCSGTLINSKADIVFESKVVGKLLVPNVEHLRCPKCSSYLMSFTGAGQLFHYVRQKESETILQQPIKDFVAPKQAYEILDISKQAFSKNPRIKKGMILSATIDGKKYYLRKSVELFKQKNDGRFELVKNDNKDVVVKYLVVKPVDSSPYNDVPIVDSLIDETKWDRQYDIKISPNFIKAASIGGIYER